jgi:hypothetical protein
MEIFKQQAQVTRDAATAQRVFREQAQAERVIEEECKQQQAATAPTAQVENQEAPAPTFQIEDENIAATAPQAIPQIMQDEYISPPSANTRQQREVRTLTQDFMLQCMEIPGYKAPFTSKQAAARKYPLQFLCDLAYAVLDDETGNLLEFRHLMKHPKYKDVWTKSFNKEIIHLATMTETIFFIQKDAIPQEC